MKIKTMFESLDVAFSMYSAIPMPQVMWNEQNMKYMLGFFPLIGLVQAALLIGWVYLAQALSVGTVLFAAVAALIPLFVTGGIHLDGFCDTVDALASHQTREKKLEILKDPSICCDGMYGLFALNLCALDPAAGRILSACGKGDGGGLCLFPRDECGSCCHLPVRKK